MRDRFRRRVGPLLLSLAVAGLMAGLMAGPLVTPVLAQQTAGADRIPLSGVPMAEGWRHLSIVKGLAHPWGMAFVPESNMILITERGGDLRLVRDQKLTDAPVRGVPTVMAKGQGGLLDISLHPDFANNRHVYLTYAAGSEDANRTTLARGRLSEDGTELTDVQTLYEVKPDKPGGQHFGSRLAWLPDGTLLMSIGDGGNPPNVIDGMPARDHAQRLDTPFGSILRLNDDGSIPEDNPLVGRENALPEIYSYGHRNIQGLTVTPDGEVWATEHGPLGGDELNHVRRGENHGWPLNAHGLDYRTGAPINPDRKLDDAVDPKLIWTPCIAPSGLAVYTGDRFTEWKGDLLGGGLLTKDVRRIRIEGDRVVREETMPLASRVRAVTVGPDGLIYVLTDEEKGELVRIEPPGATDSPEQEPSPQQPVGRNIEPAD